MMNLRLVQSASDRIASDAGLQSLLVSTRVSGSVLKMRAQAGAQYDTSRWRFGGALRTPGFTLHRTGAVTMDGVVDTGAAGSGASLFDPEAQLEYHLPWEFQGGAAFVAERFEVEVDVQAYTAISSYSMISTTHPLLIYTDAGANTPPSVTSRPFPGLLSASRGIVNVGAGGHVRLLENRKLLLHAGVGSNRSPTAAADTIFNTVDLITWSVGLSGTLGRFQFAAGLNRQGGREEDVVMRNLLNGEVVHSAIDLRTIGFIYSLAFQF